MKRFYFIIIVFVTFASSISCLDNDVKKVKTTTKKTPDLEAIKYQIDFPDTVYVNKLYHGEIKYESALDSVITTFGSKDKNRYTRFIMRVTKDINYSHSHLKKIAQDTFGAIDNRTIPFYDIKFSKTGVQYIDGIVNDLVLINLATKDSEGNDLTRLIENEQRITHKVFVRQGPGSNEKKEY